MSWVHPELTCSGGGTWRIPVPHRHITQAERSLLRDKNIPRIVKPTIFKKRTFTVISRDSADLPQTAKVANVAGLKSVGSDFADDSSEFVEVQVESEEARLMEELKRQNASLKRALTDIAWSVAKPKGMAKPSSSSKITPRPSTKPRPSTNLI